MILWEKVDTKGRSCDGSGVLIVTGSGQGFRVGHNCDLLHRLTVLVRVSG